MDSGGRVDRAEPRDRDIYGVRLGVESVKLVLPTKRIWRAAVGVAPERGVTGIAAGRRETIGEAGVGWRRRTESRFMTGLLCRRGVNRIPALHNFSLRSLRAVFKRAFPWPITQYSNRPFDRQTAFACETTGCLESQCSGVPRCQRARAGKRKLAP